MTKKALTISLFIAFIFSAQFSIGNVEEIKSGIIYYIAKNVKWPTDKQSGDFIITIVGYSETTDQLRKMAETKKLGTRNIIIKAVPSVKDVKESHILFLPENEAQHFQAAKYQAQNIQSLLITESEGLAARGSLINLIEVNGRMTYEVNQTSFDRSDLKISSRLLTLAHN